MLHLLCVPAGCSASSDFFAKARQQEYGRSLLVAASTALVHKARMHGVKSTVKFDYLANAVPAAVREVTCAASDERPGTEVGNMVQALQEQGRLPYFAKLSAKKGFLRSVTSLMDQLGSCGVTPEEIVDALLPTGTGVTGHTGKKTGSRQNFTVSISAT